jgi:hypothetical protein
VALCAKYLENQSPSRRQFIALVTLTFGVMMSVHSGAEGEPIGLILVGSSTLVMSLQMSFSGRIMQEKINPLFLVVCSGPVAFLSLAPFAWMIEGQAFSAYITDNGYNDALMMIATNSILAATYTCVVLSLIREISSVGVALVGNCQLLLLLFLADVCLGEMTNLSLRKILGVVLTVGGAVAYTTGRLDQTASSKVPDAGAAIHQGVSWRTWWWQAFGRRASLFRWSQSAKLSDAELDAAAEANLCDVENNASS